MRPKLIGLGVLLVLLGAATETITAIKLGQLSDRRDASDDEIRGILNAHMPGYKMTRDENGRLRYEKKEKQRFRSGRSNVVVRESFMVSTITDRFDAAERRGEQIQSEMLFWQPMVRIGLAPIGVGLVLVAGTVFSYWRSKTPDGKSVVENRDESGELQG
jgi:hypothetical protein